jgi:hypothetical protein
MTEKEIDIMYKGVPKELFRVHNWKKDLSTVGVVPPNLFLKCLKVKLIITGQHR